MPRRGKPSQPRLADSSLSPVPAGAPPWVTPELIAHTLRVWQPYYSEPLTADDALGMIINVAALWELLAQESTP